MASKENEFVQHLVDQLQMIGQVNSRRMFGGHGLFLDGLMFGLVASDILYFKADESSRCEFEEERLEAFSYKRQGKLCKLSYYEAPDYAMDNSDALSEWANRAYSAALRAAAAKNSKGKKKQEK